MIAGAVAAVAVVLGGGVGVGWGMTHLLVGPPPSAGRANTGLGRTEAAIVDINTNLTGGRQGAGTGMVLTSTGEVLTNNHVVAGATSIEVTVPSTSDTYGAHVLGVDPSADVALIQLVGASRLPTIPIASASELKTGVPIAAVGNALGQGGAPSVTNGSIAALNQAITASTDTGSEHLSGLIETDAPINPGDSGGALIDGSGAVLGMITAGQVRSYLAPGAEVGFAIPLATAMTIVSDIRAGRATDGVVIEKSG